MQHVWWPRCESLDNAVVHGGVTVHDFMAIWHNGIMHNSMA